MEVVDRAADLDVEELAGPSGPAVAATLPEGVDRVGDAPSQTMVLDLGGRAFPAVTRPAVGRWPAERVGEVRRRVDLDLQRRLLSTRRVLVLVDGQPLFKDAPKSTHGFARSASHPG